jgi:hypothetical protein
MTLIQNIVNGYLPPTANGIKEAIDHCEETIEDCNNTLVDPEVAEHDKKNYREMRHLARAAKTKLTNAKK